VRERKSKRQTGNGKQRSVNSKQQTENGKQREAIPNSKFQIPDSKSKDSNKPAPVIDRQIGLAKFADPKSENNRNPKVRGFLPPKIPWAFGRFRPPLRAMVEAARRISDRNKCLGKDRSVYGKVLGLAGPWRTSGEWWRSDLWAEMNGCSCEAKGQRPEPEVRRSEVRGQRLEVGGQKSEGSKIKEVGSQIGAKPNSLSYLSRAK